MKADPHKDGIASLIVSIGNKVPKGEDVSKSEDVGEPDDLHLAMQEFGEKLAAKDYKGAASAFAMAHELCGYGPTEDDDCED